MSCIDGMNFSNRFELEDCVKLWRDIFGDDEEFIRDFYDIVNIRSDVFTAYYDDVLCGMVHRLPIEFDGHTGAYIYGACTDERFRGLGIFKKLLTMTETDMPFVMLIPESRDLFAMYKKLGYDHIAYGEFPCEIPFVEFDKKSFDGDFKYLYELYLKNLKPNEFLKAYDLFILSLKHFAEQKMIYYIRDGFIVCEIINKKVIKIYEIYCKDYEKYGIITSYEKGVYKFGNEICMPDSMRVNLFMEM